MKNGKGSINYRGFANNLSMVVVAVLACLTLAAGGLNAQSVRSLDITAHGLPAGLSVSFNVSAAHCNGNSVSLIPVGSVNLDERTLTTYETVILPGGQISLRAIVRTDYVGDLTVALPASNACSAGIPPTTVSTFFAVLGEQNGSTAFRRTGAVGMVLSNAATTVNQTISAFTRKIVDSDIFAAPTSLNRSTTGFNHWSVAYADSFSSADIDSPSLSFTQPGFGFGGNPITLTRIRMSLTTNGQVCLLVDGTSQCKARSLGGTLVNGPVTMSVAQLQDSSSVDRSVFWVFRIDPSFSAGNFSVVGSAVDDDPMEYMVDGVAEPLDLLPWKTLKIPVTVN